MIVVEDDGPGIPPHALERIFERFYTDRPSEGFGQNSGLGLSISRQIVEAHGGRIWADNRPLSPRRAGRRGGDERRTSPSGTEPARASSSTCRRGAMSVETGMHATAVVSAKRRADPRPLGIGQERAGAGACSHGPGLRGLFAALVADDRVWIRRGRRPIDRARARRMLAGVIERRRRGS